MAKERRLTRLTHFANNKEETHFKHHKVGSVLVNMDGAAIRLADELWQFTNKGEVDSHERKVGNSLFTLLRERKILGKPIDDIEVEFDYIDFGERFVVEIVDYYILQDTTSQKPRERVDPAMYLGIKDFGVF